MVPILPFKNPESFRTRWLDADQYANSGQIEKALDVFESLAAEGYSEACAEIGNILERGGEGVAQDLDAARSWYMRAIDEMNDDYGYVGLARLALQGFSDAGEPSDAVDYLRKACDAGNPIALTILGTLYYSGRIVPYIQQAIQLYEKASEQGYVLPLAYLSKAKIDQGHYISGLWLRLKAGWTAFRLATKNSSDRRLWGYL